MTSGAAFDRDRRIHLAALAERLEFLAKVIEDGRARGRNVSLQLGEQDAMEWAIRILKRLQPTAGAETRQPTDVGRKENG